MRGLPDYLEPTREMCPSCGYPCASPCCPVSPRHTVCQRCKRIFISRAAPALSQVEGKGRP